MVNISFHKLKKVMHIILNRPKGFSDYCLSIFSALIKSRTDLCLPVHITIEPTNICNLRCPICETGAGVLKRTKGMMSLADFKLVIDKISRFSNSIFFYYMGEPFLNPGSYAMIRYAKDKGLYVNSCTNGHFLDADKLISSGLDEISIQIGGISQETHEIYRVGSNLSEILTNVKKLVAQKKHLGKNNPKIILGFIVMKHNEAEVKGFLSLAKEIGVDEARILNPCVRNIEQGVNFLPIDKRYWIYDQESFGKGELIPENAPKNRCNWIYVSSVILFNGDVAPCCRDADADFVMGNLFLEDFSNIWNNKKYRDFRKKIAHSQKDLPICKLCSGFKIPSLYE